MSPFLAGITWLLLFQCMGETLVRIAALPIPGPVARPRVALGLAAHGIGTARAFQINAEAGASASLAFALHGMLAAILFPLGFWLWSLRAGP